MSTDDTGGGLAASASTAKDEGARLAGAAADSGQDLLHEVKDEAADLVGEAAHQARDLLGEARDGLTAQASEQQVRAAAGLRAIGEELGRMADGAQDGGLARDLVRQAADRTGGVAAWLDAREPGDVLHEVTDLARRRPGLFLAVAAGAGVLVGRLTRGLKDAPATTGSSGSSGGGAHVADGGYSTPPTDTARTASPTATTAPTPATPAAVGAAYADAPGGFDDAPLPGGATTGGVGGPAPVAPASGQVPAAGPGGTAGGDPLAGVRDEERL